MSFGTYVHIPFCEQHCHYCAFPVVVMPQSSHQPYTECLQAEIRQADLPATTDTLYLGGGTPSLLAPDLMERLISALPRGATEISLEANPGTLDPTRLKTFRQLGINRISLGAQSFDAADLKMAGRLHQAMDSVHDFERLRNTGFENISIDLIAGLPGQKRRAWGKNLEWIDQLRPDHVSVYLLEVEDSSLWGKHTHNCRLMTNMLGTIRQWQSVWTAPVTITMKFQAGPCQVRNVATILATGVNCRIGGSALERTHSLTASASGTRDR